MDSLDDIQGVRHMMGIGQDREILVPLEQVGFPRGRTSGRGSRTLFAEAELSGEGCKIGEGIC